MKDLTLEKELAALKYSYNSFKSRMQYDKTSRTFYRMAQAFGKKTFDERLLNKSIWFPDLEIYHKQIEQLIKEKYVSKRFLKEPEAVERTILEELSIRENALVKTENDNQRENSSWIEKYPDQKVDLITDLCNQPLAAKTLWDNLSIKDYRGQLLLAPPGIGKTYILASVIKNFIKQGWIKKLGNLSPWPIVYVTKATIVEQTESVLRDKFGIDVVNTVHVINIELLRTKFGKNFVKDVVKVKNGEPFIDYEWNSWLAACLWIWDECQGLARQDSTQSKIANALNNVTDKIIYQIDASATPFSRVIETKHFTCSTKKEFFFGMEKQVIDNKNFNEFCRIISDPSNPEDYSEFAIKQYMDFMEDRIVRVKDIKLKYKSFITTTRLQFRTKEEKEEFDKAWTHYQEKKAKIEGDESLSESQGRFALLAQFTIFRKAAEKIRRYHLAEFANSAWENGEAPAIACAFKGTMVAVYRILVEDYNWCREDVSFIWGGATEALNEKAKIAKKMKEAGLDEKLKGLGISMADLGIDLAEIHEKSKEQYDFEKIHKLLTQKPEHREEERLRYQRQDSRLLIFSYKAGGVGLSAHHEREYPNARPRRGIFTPIYSEKEMIQAFGRLPRITSISDTYSIIAYYGGTIEDNVLERLKMKLKSARHVGKGKESWEDIITGTNTSNIIPDFDSIEDEDPQDNINQVFLEETTH